MFKRIIGPLAAFCAVTALGLILSEPPAAAQAVPPQAYTTVVPVASVTATGTTTAIIAPAANKTYQMIGSVASGTGTAVVTVQGSNDGIHYDTITSFSVTSSVGGTSTSTSSTDRYGLIRANVTSLTGTTPSLILNFGF